MAGVGGGDVLHRARLDVLFRRISKRPVVTVVAGPGYGKTVAVASYLNENAIRTVWIQLSADDNMPTHFWETFSQAYMMLNPNLANTILALGFPATTEMRHYVAEVFAAELRARFDYALVFDDLHLLNDGPVRTLISQIVHLSSPRVKLFMISRHDNLPDADVFLRDRRLLRVDENDLVFTKNELAECFEHRGIMLSNELLADIYHDTEGVPFAVSLATSLLERNPDDRAYIRTTFRDSFGAIINNELFSRISEAQRHFLVQLSLIRHLSPELISTFKNGQRLMDEFVHISSLIRYDNYMHVYRIHHLLLHYLQNKQDILTDDERLEANEKAAHWCVTNGYKIDALSHYRAINDYGSIIKIAYTYPPVIPFDVAFELFDIFEDAPPEMLDTYPSARILYTRLIMTVDRVEKAIERIGEHIALLEARPPSEATSYTLMGLYNNLGFAKMVICPETHDYNFAPYFEKALEYYATASKPPKGGWSVYNVGPYALRLGQSKAGDPENYIEMISRSIPCATATLQGCGQGLDDLLRSEYAFFRGMASEAERYALRCLEPAHDFGQFEIESRALLLLARTHLQQGRYEQIMNTLSQMERLTSEVEFANRHLLYEIITSWFFIAIGEFNRAASWLKNDLWSVGPNNLFDGLDDLIKVKYYFISKNYRTMLDFLDSRTTHYGISRYIIGKIGVAACRAVALCHLGDRAGALKWLKEAYDLAEPNGFTMQFVELGNAMRTLAGMALKANAPGIPAAWLETIKRRSTTYAKRLAHVRSRYLTAHNLNADTQLTAKELAVLADLAQGLSRTEISLAHNISINTVKTMLQMIYGKLGAENAMDAVRIATAKQML
jgi:LuxR family maltose regulon positive regulatory protein